MFTVAAFLMFGIGAGGPFWMLWQEDKAKAHKFQGR